MAVATQQRVGNLGTGVPTSGFANASAADPWAECRRLLTLAFPGDGEGDGAEPQTGAELLEEELRRQRHCNAGCDRQRRDTAAALPWESRDLPLRLLAGLGASPPAPAPAAPAAGCGGSSSSSAEARAAAVSDPLQLVAVATAASARHSPAGPSSAPSALLRVPAAPPGNVTEVVGEAGAGKTQLALAVAAACAARGHQVIFVSTSDDARAVARRLAQILATRLCGPTDASGENSAVAAALARVRIELAADFAVLAELIGAEDGPWRRSSSASAKAGEAAPALLIVDGLSTVLEPFAAAAAHRWRAAWTWRALHRIAADAKVLTFTHPPYGAKARSSSAPSTSPMMGVAAPGASAAPGAGGTTRFELTRDAYFDGAVSSRGIGSSLNLVLTRCPWGLENYDLKFTLGIDDSGIFPRDQPTKRE
eukprot:TRINITY_DN11469_c1_g1_i1.p1 TRINITY_DN11469_c1_g1~~TRINITY_DN11469_c1_g1_i1.p1  ORF type:complete len:437 (-),score=109.70 TRINITY_DN11469_c1_g1_i1:70-1338(-)